MNFWRNAGLNYVQYSSIAARLLRQALKADVKADAMKRDGAQVRITRWKDGKAIKEAI